MGSNDHGQCGTGAAGEPVPRPAAVRLAGRGGLRGGAAAVGDSHMVAVGAGGETSAWGLSDRGQCAQGDGAAEVRSGPAVVLALDDQQVSAVACGFEHSLAALAPGGVVAWGSDEYGQCGVGKPPAEEMALKDFYSNPKIVRVLKGVQVRAVACGAYHSLCLTMDSAVFAW